MNKKTLAIFSAAIVLLLLILLITAAVIASGFFTDGVHIIGNYAHISFSQKCYVLDTSEPVAKGDTPPIVGQSTFSVSGYLYADNDDATSPFYGNMEVSDYPLSFTNSYGNIGGYISSKSLTLENRSATDFTDETLWYYVEILKSDRDICVIHVFNTETEENHLLVCGENEDDAISNYKTYLDKTA